MRVGQCLLASPRFSILGNLSKCSGSSILNESLNSRLCLRNTRLSFFEVDRMPVIRSCEFYVFSSEGLAVSTFLWSSEPALTAASRLPFSKEGVRMERLSGSRGVRGEASQRQSAWWLKKSGGSLELRMRMFLRRDRLLLRQLGSSSELSMQNYMLEIQLFDERMHPAQCRELPSGYISKVQSENEAPSRQEREARVSRPLVHPLPLC